MNSINNNWKINQQKIVIFGAGKIGRSFIGQLFATNGYQVTFVDADQQVVHLLNEKKEYRVIIKSEQDTEINVQNVDAISCFDTEKVANTVASADILAVSVGKNALPKVTPLIAAGLEIRRKQAPEAALDIILAENMLEAACFVHSKLKESLTPDYPIEKLVGLVETSIGKMVPIIPATELEKDPLIVLAEPYNTLIVDKKGFKNPVPAITELAAKENIKAWVDRKAFIHNLGHATAAYYGYYKHPEATYMYEILDDQEVLDFTRLTMMQAAKMLQYKYFNDFSLKNLTEHVDDLLYRFRNKALKDTVFRVGQDLIRKLGANDRFMGAIHLARRTGSPHDQIIKAMSYGFLFHAQDEQGQSNPSDLDFLAATAYDFKSTLTNVLGFNAIDDLPTIRLLEKYYNSYKTVNTIRPTKQNSLA